MCEEAAARVGGCGLLTRRRQSPPLRPVASRPFAAQLRLAFKDNWMPKIDQYVELDV